MVRWAGQWCRGMTGSRWWADPPSVCIQQVSHLRHLPCLGEHVTAPAFICLPVGARPPLSPRRAHFRVGLVGPTEWFFQHAHWLILAHPILSPRETLNRQMPCVSNSGTWEQEQEFGIPAL